MEPPLPLYNHLQPTDPFFSADPPARTSTPIARARVQAALDQLLNHRRRPLHHFTSGDPFGQLGRHYVDSGFLRHRLYFVTDSPGGQLALTHLIKLFAF